jgi:hypothetical protein
MIIENFKYCFIQINPNCKIVGIQMSGGADSSLAAYMYAYTIKKHSLQTRLKRITFGFGNKPDYFLTAQNIQNTITDILDYDCWDAPYEKYYNNKHEHSTRDVLTTLYTNKIIDHVVNGRTRNPPPGAIHDYTNNRVLERDNPVKLNFNEISEPFYNLTKDIIVSEYLNLGIYQSLFFKTNSCDAEKSIKNFPCGECWWCRERKWAIEMVFKNDNTSA